ncbi:RNA-binding protein 48 [Echinops telfairi]|uniref:RNA-binding protein 48 n=1 Tax=Echinops telfairi TaxID=9371 RepID=A0ABM0ILB9_ECHTE|nr:RNA-binding protein 48 [Echinops telfairi]
MASSGGELGSLFDHHVQKPVCDSRAKYRDGRRPRAVKVYTINLESRYLLIQGVPAVGAMKELVERFALYGAIEQYNALDEYPAEDFTEVYLIKFLNLQNARTAKKKMDEQSFFGGLLHVCYAPEFETVEETRKKLRDRRAYIARTTTNKDNSRTKKKQATEQRDTSDGRRVFHSETPGFGVAEVNSATRTSNPYPCDLPSCYLTCQCVCSSQGHGDRASHFSPDGRGPSETVGRGNHSTSLQQTQLKTLRTPVACLGAQKALPLSEAIDRFMPRTTQLQERKRRREDDCRLGTCVDASRSHNEVMIGPQLPGIPKVDMHDDSLNTTANLIRNKLKEVILPVPTPLADKLEDVRSRSRPLKQRRRI